MRGESTPRRAPPGPLGNREEARRVGRSPRCLPLGTVSSHSGATSWAPGFMLLARGSPWEGRQRRGAGRGVDRARSAPRCEEAAGPGAPGTGVGCRRPRRRHRLHAVCGQGHCRTRVTPGSRAPRGAQRKVAARVRSVDAGAEPTDAGADLPALGRAAPGRARRVHFTLVVTPVACEHRLELLRSNPVKWLFFFSREVYRIRFSDGETEAWRVQRRVQAARPTGARPRFRGAP